MAHEPTLEDRRDDGGSGCSSGIASEIVVMSLSRRGDGQRSRFPRTRREPQVR
jgi:hypothetical protein